MSKFRPPSYRSSRDPASQRGCDVITPLSFIISIDKLASSCPQKEWAFEVVKVPRRKADQNECHGNPG